MNISPELPPVHADENRLQQIFHNLIGNAIKFTESGQVKISAKVVDHFLEVTVSDTGIGIEKNQFERIFDSFEQGDGSTAREYGGSGLGLAVTRQLVQLHGGKIWLESSIGVGSQFFFTLPISKAPSQVLNMPFSKVQVPLAETTTDNPVAGTKKDQFKILIVDDEPVNLQVLKNYLSLQNYYIVQANNGPQALAFIEKGFRGCFGKK